MASKQEFAAVVDIGSTRITALAGTRDADGTIGIVGQAEVLSRGIRRGVVVNSGELSGALRTLMAQLETRSEGKIRIVDAAMAGQGISTVVYEGTRYIESGIVSQADVDYLENEAMNMPLEPGHRVYHLFPGFFTIGDDLRVTVPVGHEGRKMTARYTLITAPSSYRENVAKAFSTIGVKLGRLILSPVALAEAVISQEEKELGVVLVDIGGGTTKVTAFADGRLTHMSVIPFGGEVITHDIREGCSIPSRTAEQMKIQYGQAIGDFADDENYVSIPGYNGWESKTISFKALAFIIQARLEEIIDSIFYQVEKSGFPNQPAQGVVVTGGTSRLPNLLQLVKFRTGMDARPGFCLVPAAEITLTDEYAFLGAIGLLHLFFKDNSHVNRIKLPKIAALNEINGDGISGNGFLSNLGKKVTHQISMIFEDDDQ